MRLLLFFACAVGRTRFAHGQMLLGRRRPRYPQCHRYYLTVKHIEDCSALANIRGQCVVNTISHKLFKWILEQIETVFLSLVRQLNALFMYTYSSRVYLIIYIISLYVILILLSF